jgi:hypothetical protein
MLVPAVRAGHVLEGRQMLSTPEKRFIWARPDGLVHVTFFRTLILRRPRKSRRVVAAMERAANGKWKPAKWTPWLWVK